MPEWQQRHVNRRPASSLAGVVAVQPGDNKPMMRVKDVMYWYIDYREFANVVKYRIAMMRKAIDEKIKQVGRVQLDQD